MRRGFLFVFSFINFLMTYAQLAEPLYFREKTHDFGEILESKGNAEYEFTFLNNSGRPIRIVSVQASCGCTTPGWTKESIEPGKSGFIKASFDPKGRPGYFNKSLTVTTDLNSNPIQLQIKGTVVDKFSARAEDKLTVSIGNLKLAQSSFNLGKVFINQEAAVKSFSMLNGGTEKLLIQDVVAPAYITIVHPAAIAPGEVASIQIKYDARARNQYGFQSDNIEIKTNDKDKPVKSVSVYATIEEFFPPITAEEMLRAPLLVTDKSVMNFPRMKPGDVTEQVLVITNKGKKPLDIRAIQSNCSCVQAALTKKMLKPNESVAVNVSFNAEGRTGTQNKAITIYSTDPRNAIQRVTITGYIEE